MKKRINKKFNNRFKSRFLFKSNILIFGFFIIINFFIPKISNNNSGFLIGSKFSSITLKIEGFGNKDVFSRSTYFESEYYPDMVYINGIKEKQVKCGYDFNQTENFVELIRNNSINDSRNMFYKCYDIIEIDMTNFDTSQITMMLYMFDGCSSLKFLNLSNFNTSQVESMYSMFHSCYSLTSLNLSSFDTSQVSSMGYMFYNCINLQYINLQNFDESASGYFNEMFKNVPKNFVICINETKNDKIISAIPNKNCYINYCNDDWKSKQKK